MDKRMKLEDFKSNVEKMGFFVNEYDYNYSIESKLYGTFIDIKRHVVFAIDTTYSLFYKLAEDEPETAEKLYDLCVEFARTPIDERKSEIKY